MRMFHSRAAAAALCLISSACSVQQENGDAVQFERPFFLGRQEWRTDHYLTKGRPTCDVMFGELAISQQRIGKETLARVFTTNSLNPGDSYKILVAGHVYETTEAWFDAKQSQAIIHDFETSDIAYTEKRRYTLGVNSKWRNIDNKIPLGQFAANYTACAGYLAMPATASR